MANKLNIEELLKMVENSEENYNVGAGSSKYSFSVINSRNGKRITISKMLAKDLELTDKAYILPIPQEKILILSKESISSKSAAAVLNKDDKKTCYSASLVDMITKAFSFDYNHISSLSFNNVEFDVIDEKQVAIVHMIPKSPSYYYEG